MRARKFYEEQILKLLENMPEEELPTVVSMIEKLRHILKQSENLPESLLIL